MRGVGLVDGSGDGEGLCANVFSGVFDATKPAAPNAGKNFTNERRLFEVLRLMRFSFPTVSDLTY